jgi:hypothetical protein
MNGVTCNLATSTCQAGAAGDLGGNTDLQAAGIIGTKVAYPTGSAPGDGFGYAVAMTSTYAVFGSPYDKMSAGFASVSDIIGSVVSPPGTVLGAQSPDVPTTNDAVGISVAASNNTIAIGAYGRDGVKGAVYVWVKGATAWMPQQKLVATDPVAGDYFGVSVSLYNDTLVVGAHNKSAAMGAAYAFTRAGTTWTGMKLTSPADLASLDYFGLQVAATPTVIAVAAPGHLQGRGAVYLYHYDTTNKTWATSQPLPVPISTQPGDQLGQALQMSSNYLAIGAPGYSQNGVTDQGAVYLLPLAGGPMATLLSLQPQFRDRFGYALSLVPGNGAVSDTLLVGAPGRQQAMLFRPNASQQWTQQAVLDPPADGRNASFGAAVATSGTQHLVGIRGYSQDIGGVYAFSTN